MMKTQWVLVFLIVLLVAGAYLNSLDNGFLWDDEYLIRENALRLSLDNVAGAFRRVLFIGFEEGVRFYRPIQSITYMLDYTMGGVNPRFYHSTNVIIHIVNCLLVFLLCRHIFNSWPPALIAALFFGLHPVQTEAVTYISGRADPLACAFILLAVLSFARAVNPVGNSVMPPRIKDTSNGVKLKSLFFYAACLFLFAGAVLSKENSLILPLLLLCYDVNLSPRLSRPKSGDSIKRGLYVIMICGIIVYCLCRMRWMGPGAGYFSGLAAEIGPRTLKAIKAFGAYLGILIAPVNLHMERSLGQPSTLFEPAVFISALLLFGFAAAAAASFRKNKAMCFGACWFFSGLLPVSGLFPLNADMAEHWLYLPSVGAGIFVASLLKPLIEGREKGLYLRRFAIGSCIILFGIFFFLTARQNRYWAEPIEFYKRTLKFAPDSYRVNFNLGKEYFQRRDYARAIESYKRAVRISSSNDMAYNNLGGAYQMMGRLDEAAEQYRKSIELAPSKPLAYVNLANILAQKGRLDEARDLYKKAIEVAPQDSVIRSEYKRFEENLSPFPQAQ